MSSITITREHTPTGGRHVGRVDGLAGGAELTDCRAGRGLIRAEHTFAPDAMRGTGVAKALVGRLVDDARAEGCRVIPLCPYVRSQLERHPEWSDVIAR